MLLYFLGVKMSQSYFEKKWGVSMNNKVFLFIYYTKFID